MGFELYLQRGIHDSRRQYQATPNVPVVDLFRCKAGGNDIVRAPNENDMNEAHPDHQGYNAQSHDFVLSKEPLGADISPTDAHQDDDQGESVHHHDTSKVGLSCIEVCGGGGLEYSRRSRDMADVLYAHQPPQRGERGVGALRNATRACRSMADSRSCCWCN